MSFEPYKNDDQCHMNKFNYWCKMTKHYPNIACFIFQDLCSVMCVVMDHKTHSMVVKGQEVVHVYTINTDGDEIFLLAVKHNTLLV